MGTVFSQEQIIALLDKLYEKATQGVYKVSPPIEDLARDYLLLNTDTETAAKKFIHYQIAKCTTSGFLTGLGGLITLPVTIPANISSVMYVQMRMIACLAYMGGYDIKCDQVQTLVYACLAGVSVDQILKRTGIQFGNKLATSLVKKIPGKALTKINQKVGFRFITKFGTKGIINIGKTVPVVGGFISGGFDYAETKAISRRAYKMFINGRLDAIPQNADDLEQDDVEDIVNEVINPVIDNSETDSQL